MNKTELVAAIAEETEMTKVAAAKAVDAMMKVVTETLAKGESVTLIGFGTFVVRDRAARVGRDPRNPEKEIKIPASKVPAFRAGKGLKQAVNN